MTQFLNKYIQETEKENIFLKNILKKKPSIIFPPHNSMLTCPEQNVKKKNTTPFIYKNLLKSILEKKRNIRVCTLKPQK